MARPQDVRMLVVYGYARLVGYDSKFDLHPDILRARRCRTRPRVHAASPARAQWSDGQPFTAEDFRYWWEDVTHNKQLSRVGLPVTMLSNGKPPKFEVLGPLTVRYSWESAQPLFPARPGRRIAALHLPPRALSQAVS